MQPHVVIITAMLKGPGVGGGGGGSSSIFPRNRLLVVSDREE